MALLFPGKTECLLCGKVIQQGDAIVAFPAFLRRSHPLSRYSDAVFHATCFVASPDKEAVEVLFKRHEEIWNSRPRHLKTLAEIEAWGTEAFKDFK